MKFIKKWLPFILFLLICTVIGETSFMIRQEHLSLIVILVIAILGAFYIGDVTEGIKNGNDDDE